MVGDTTEATHRQKRRFGASRGCSVVSRGQWQRSLPNVQSRVKIAQVVRCSHEKGDAIALPFCEPRVARSVSSFSHTVHLHVARNTPRGGIDRPPAGRDETGNVFLVLWCHVRIRNAIGELSLSTKISVRNAIYQLSFRCLNLTLVFKDKN